MKAGLVSVTFRQLAVPEIIALAKKSGLAGIEWGADVHVPGPQAAAAVRKQTEAAGLAVLSLGSYYRAGEGQAFSPVLETAKVLGAPCIRVWAGTKNSEDASFEYRQAVVADLKSICGQAAQQGIALALEYHGNTLTNRAASCVTLLEEVGSPNLHTYWQPLAPDFAANRASLEAVCATGKLKYLHVYHWIEGERCPLADAAEGWAAYLQLAQAHAEAALLEFVRGDDPAQLLTDAETLNALLKEADEHAV